MMRRALFLLPVLALVSLVPAGGVAHAADDFVLSANLSGLYPNVDADFPVSVSNPKDFAIAVHSATVAIGDASPSCTAANLSARSFSGNVVVPADGSTTFPIHLHMAASAPNACQGVTFPLTFTATGTPVGATPGGDGTNGDGVGAAATGFAFTGADSLMLGAIGLGATAVGLVLVRRRRPTETAS